MLESRAIFFKSKGCVDTGKVLLDDIDLEENDLLLETQVSLVSTGTEMRLLMHGYKGTDYPFVPGYSAVCKVIKKEPGAAGFEVGDLVFTGGGNRIAEGAASLWGCHSQYQIFNAGGVHKLSGKLTPEEYAFGKVASISLHGVRISQIEPSEKVVVLGLGLIGQFSVRCLLARGAEVIACDTNKERLETVRKLGVEVINPSSSDMKKEIYQRWPLGPDAVFEVTAKAGLIRTAISLLRERGYDGHDKLPRLVLQANYIEEIVFGNRDIYEKEAVVLSPRDVQPGDLEAVLRMMESGVITLKDLFQGTESPDNAADAYKKLMEQPDKYYTILFDWKHNK